MLPSRPRSMTPVILAGLLLLLSAPAARASWGVELLHLEMARAAEEIHTWLGDRSVQIAPFTSPNTKLATGRGLARLLEKALRDAGAKVQDDGLVSIRGTYRDASDPDLGLAMVKVQIDVTDGRGGRKPLEISLMGREVVLLLFPHVLPLDRKPEMTFTREGEIYPKAESKFAIKVWMSDPSELPRTRLVDGLAQVDLKPGRSFMVEVFNNADHDVVVVLAINGVNLFAFREKTDATPMGQVSRIIVRKGKRRMLRGWFLDMARTETFRVGALGPAGLRQAPAAPGEMGLITALFYPCQEKVQAAPQPTKGNPKTRLVRVTIEPMCEAIPVLYPLADK